MSTILLLFLFLQEKHGKAYELGYFLGSNILYILPILLLIVSAVTAFIFIKTSRHKKNIDE